MDPSQESILAPPADHHLRDGTAFTPPGHRQRQGPETVSLADAVGRMSAEQITE
ncbi:MAG: hypothetical protein M3O28_00390 [Actinomycetota bacterium]|nr:hypothetical protein [Actinomycetota bacterium]